MVTTDSRTDLSRRRLLSGTAAGWLLSASCVTHGASDPAAFVNYARRDDVRLWAAQVSEKRGIPFSWIIQALTLARTNATTVKIMSRPALTATSTPKDWFKHRRTYVNAARVSNAQVFIREHAAAFTESWKRYQVPPQIVAAVIGVETNYGRLTGNIRTLDALCTLSFDYTRRAAFFQNELESFLALMWQGKADPTSVKGSFAGALGICQFMPSNIEKLGVDLDGDGVVNLSESADDAIGSAAHYLREVGWVRGLPVSWPCRVTPEIVRWFDTGEARLTTSLQNLLDAGIELPAPLPVSPKTPVLLVSLPAGKTTVYRVGTANFAALLDYNRSFFYAQTVSDLADSILSGEVLPPEALPAA